LLKINLKDSHKDSKRKPVRLQVKLCFSPLLAAVGSARPK
jgi:hypothetical protein